MSYCRRGDDSDLYVYHSIDGWVCCECLIDGASHIEKRRKGMLLHLLEHKHKAKHKVPQYAIDRLTDEINAKK